MEISKQPQETQEVIEASPSKQPQETQEVVEASSSKQPQETRKVVEASPSRGQSWFQTKKNEDRIVMLTDGIFAIALTLIVLSIQIPSVNSPKAFNDALTGDFRSNTMYYVITFAVLMSYWQSHRHLMNLIERVDDIFILINLIFLAFVAFFPVTNSLLKNAQFPMAVILYTIVLAGCGYTSSLLWIYALGKHRMVAAEADIRMPTYRIINTAIHPTFFLLSLLLLFIPSFSPPNIFFCWLILPFVSIIYTRIIKKLDTSKWQQSSL